MRPVDDIRKIPKTQKRFQPLTHSVPSNSAPVNPEILNLRPAYIKREAPVAAQPSFQPIIQKVEQPIVKSTWTFKKSFVLVPFTIFVLCFGAYFGARFVSFANSVSTSRESVARTISNNLGAALGPIIPGLKNLDNSDLAQAIAQKKTINVLMLGYGGEGHSGTYLTDTMMLLSINTETNKVTYVAVPRDLWVKIPTRGYDGSYSKINSAYSVGMDDSTYTDKLPQFQGADGAGNMAKYEISEVLGVPVDYYLSVDFYAFKTIVDTLGGVEVDVENSFTDYTYPSGDLNVNAGLCTADDVPVNGASGCRYLKVHFDKGLQYLDGTRALQYARSRHAAGIEGSDFSRSKRQEKLIAAIEQKAVNVGAVTKIFSLMDSVQGHFRTDMSLAEIKDLADYLSGIDMNEAGHISLTDQGANLLYSTYSNDGQWILLPTGTTGAVSTSVDGHQTIGNDINENWNSIHEYIKKNLEPAN